MKRFALILALALLVSGLYSLSFAWNGDSLTDAEKLALRIDAILDQYEAPDEFQPEYLDPYWTYEVGPFFEYEGLTTEIFSPPIVTFQPQLEASSHNHLLGYTYCLDEVFLNIRVANPVSAWYGWERNPLATLVHEMIHTLGGDFCSFDSPTAETSTQTGTLEVLAAIANGGNRVALYSLLLELEDTALDVVLADALKANDLDRYRAFLKRVDPSAVRLARFEKSMRFWAKDPATLRSTLSKYSVRVYDNVERGTLVAYLPDQSPYKGATTLKLDDLSYVLAHAEALAADALDPAEGDS